MTAPAPHFILIGNYPPDAQESMHRFTELLASGLRFRGITVEIWFPPRILMGKNASPFQGIAKWLGYIDKWILFPLWLRRAAQKRNQKFGDGVRYHICDHSNAPYLACLPANRTGITCHDVLAISGAMGDPTAYCPASRTGVFLQRWILKRLRSAKKIASVSEKTLKQLCEVTGESTPKKGWKVVHNAFNAEFKKIENVEATQILEQQGYSLPKPFILHVGSNLLRKNRRMLLPMIIQKSNWSGCICFAGASADAVLLKEAHELGISDRIYSISKPDHQTLCALYSLAHAFIFPSFSEGFGWPLIEAQACGTPVIASSLEPLPEVGGDAALYADPHDVQSFLTALQKLNDETIRMSLIKKGMENVKRFDLYSMINGYLKLHEVESEVAVKSF
jgi:glycosyltransferase involved in cell wall biosynthesis